MARKVRWGHLWEIDYRTRVGSDAWNARHPLRVRHLSVHRHLHNLSPHEDLPEGFENLNLRTKIKMARELERRRDEGE